MTPYMSNGTQSGIRKMTNSMKSIQILGHGKKITDVEIVKLFLTESELVLYY